MIARHSIERDEMSAATEETTAPSADDPSVAPDLVADLDNAIEEAMEEMAPDDVEEEKEPSAGDNAEEEESSAPTPAPAEDSAPEKETDEALMERAVKAGIPLAEAKKYTDDSLLEAMVSRLEGVDSEAGSPKGTSDEAPPAAAPREPDDLLSAIPDLDPREYDEQIVGAFKAMKGLLRKQQDVIDGLTAGGQQDWFAQKMEPMSGLLGGDASKTASVREKFETLKAGYRATGQAVTDDSVFDEAAKLVLGDAMEAAKMDAKTKAAKKRRRQHISRTSANRASSKGNAEDEVAAEIERKFFS
jgi:hypothetical protein